MSTPKNAKRVFNGKIFDVYQWRQKMFDGSYRIFERTRMASSAILIATVGKKIVVLKQKQPDTDWFLTTPSGRLDVPGERPIEAAKRELLEETGMMAKRIIPCLDVDAGRVVKGVRFIDIIDAGDPVAVARRYDEQGADEIAFLDITASSDERNTMVHVVEQVATQVFIPLTVGGGIRTIADIQRMLNAGADKVRINTAAVQNPGFVAAAARQFGSQCIVVAIDAKQTGRDPSQRQWEVYTHGGRKSTGLDAVVWARQMYELGAGEILLTSMDRDGTRAGFDLELTRSVSAAVNIPIIASGGVGSLMHLVDGIIAGKADAVLAASIFHFGEHTILEAKQLMASHNIEVRL